MLGDAGGFGEGSDTTPIETALETAGVDPKIRAERLEPERLLALARALAAG